MKQKKAKKRGKIVRLFTRFCVSVICVYVIEVSHTAKNNATRNLEPIKISKLSDLENVSDGDFVEVDILRDYEKGEILQTAIFKELLQIIPFKLTKNRLFFLADSAIRKNDDPVEGVVVTRELSGSFKVDGKRVNLGRFIKMAENAVVIEDKIPEPSFIYGVVFGVSMITLLYCIFSSPGVLFSRK